MFKNLFLIPKRVLYIAAFLAIAIASFAVSEYTIPWFSLEPGGDVLQGGEYKLEGGVVSIDLITSTGGDYTLENESTIVPGPTPVTIDAWQLH